MVGRTLVGRFRVERIIGRGGMATVYAVVDERDNRPLALKLLKRELTRDPTVLRRFEREAKAVLQLHHPNIIEVFEYGVEGEDAYIAMELAGGRDLLRALAQERPMRQLRAAILLAQVCSALDAAHAKGVIHRDLKPENIVLIPDSSEPGGERAKVLDFGIAKILDVSKPGSSDATDPPSYVTKTALTRVGTIVGTPAYMSPEQCRGGDLDGRSDVYTCGVLLYQLVTGELPFTGETPLHTAMRHIHAQPRAPRELRRDIHPHLERIILKALAKWPGERHQSAAQLREDLVSCLADLPDRGEIVLTASYSSRPAPKAPASLEPEAPQPTKMLVGGALGHTPLRAVRLGGPGPAEEAEARPAQPAQPPSQAAQAASRPAQAASQPALRPPQATSQPAPPAQKPVGALALPPPPPASDLADTRVDDDDEPRTFLMQPERSEGRPQGEAIAAPEAGERAVAPTALAETSAAPSPPIQPAVRTEQLKPRTDPKPAGDAASASIAHARTAPAGGAQPAAAPPREVPRVPARSEKPHRPSGRPVPTPRLAGTALSKNTITDLTPTSPAKVPSSGDPLTRKKEDAGPHVPASEAVSTLEDPSLPAAEPPVDDDEQSTYIREPPPDRRAPVNTTLVMEEPSSRGPGGERGAAPAPTPSPAAGRAEFVVAPTLLARHDAPTAAEIEAEALRALKATARLSPDELDPRAPQPSPGEGAPHAAVASTVRMSPDLYAAPPPSQAGGAITGQHGLAQLSAGGWNDATSSGRRLPAGRPPPSLVGELASLPGTTGFLIGIGLGLGIAAGVVIALLVTR